MKTKETYARCEHCDSMIRVSQSTKEQYENAQIFIDQDSTILIPERSVVGGKNAEFIGGYYCGPKCLIDRLSSILQVVLDTGITIPHPK